MEIESSESSRVDAELFGDESMDDDGAVESLMRVSMRMQKFLRQRICQTTRIILQFFNHLLNMQVKMMSARTLVNRELNEAFFKIQIPLSHQNTLKNR